jgi:hypothetical protein
MIGLLKLFQKKKTTSRDIDPSLPSSRKSPKYGPQNSTIRAGAPFLGE